jgi:hypothetical protein
MSWWYTLRGKRVQIDRSTDRQMKKCPPRLSPSASLRYRGVKQKQLAAILFWSTQKVAMAAVQKKKEGPASRSATQKDIE